MWITSTFQRAPRSSLHEPKSRSLAFTESLRSALSVLCRSKPLPMPVAAPKHVLHLCRPGMQSLNVGARVCWRHYREAKSVKMIQMLSLAGNPAATVLFLTFLLQEIHCTLHIAESRTAESSVHCCLLPSTHLLNPERRT